MLTVSDISNGLTDTLLVHVVDSPEDVDFVVEVNGIPIANKTYPVPKDYHPGLLSETYDAFMELKLAALNDGIEINFMSGFRSYEEQVEVYANWNEVYPDGSADRVSARPGHSVKDIQARIEPILKQAHLIHPEDKQAVLNVNAEALFGMVDSLFKGIKILSWMVGLGTLLAGAIGVSNIMMVTVKERTTEIGIRRAIGAKPQDIMSQILSESMVLTTIAGMMGISFAVFVLQMMETGTAQSDTPGHFQISFWMAIGACVILLILGMLAGLAPAYRAMAIKPIEAIRDE